MIKAFFPLLLSGAILTLGCQSNGNPSTGQTAVKDSIPPNHSSVNSKEQSPTEQADREQSVTMPADKESQATAELCACVNSFLAGMSPQVRQIIIRSSRSDTPLETLATELQQVKGVAEQERLLRELEKFESDPQLQRCSEGIMQKYNLDENDSTSREKVLKAAREREDCEVVYALMKIGLEQEKNAVFRR